MHAHACAGGVQTWVAAKHGSAVRALLRTHSRSLEVNSLCVRAYACAGGVQPQFLPGHGPAVRALLGASIPFVGPGPLASISESQREGSPFAWDSV